MASYSFEKIGDTAYAFVTLTDGDNVRISGYELADFTLELYGPDGAELTSSVPIRVHEMVSGEFEIGVYKFSVPIPSWGDEGAYTFKVVSPENITYTCMFMAYNVLYGSTDDATAQIELRIREVDGSVPASVDIDDLSVMIFNPDDENVYLEVSPTLTELEDGLFLLGFTIPDGEYGTWFVDVIDSDRFPAGKQAVWDYRDSDAPEYVTIMSPEEALRIVMLAQSSITDIVSTRIYPAQGGFEATYPIVLYTRTSSTYYDHLTGLSENGLANVSIQLDIFGHGYSSSKTTAKAIRTALNTYTGTVDDGDGNYLTIRTIRLTEEQDGFDNPDKGRTDGIFRVIQEYDVWFYNE